jgi:hypothetical protein
VEPIYQIQFPESMLMFFPNTPANAGNIGTFWTDSDTTLNPFIVNFTDGSGTFNALNKSTTLNVRCVAGFPSARRYELSDNGNSTIKDHRTGLSWMKCSDGLSGNACATGIASMVVWGTAVANCNNMAIANKKWRLPSVNELAGFFNLINPTLPSASPRVDLSYYPNTTGGLAYWASTTGTGSSFKQQANYHYNRQCCRATRYKWCCSPLCE